MIAGIVWKPTHACGIKVTRLAGTVQACIVGEDEQADELAAVVLAGFQANKPVVRLRAEQLDALPPALAAALPLVPGVREGSVAVVCKGVACLPPVREPEALLRLLGRQDRGGPHFHHGSAWVRGCRV